MKIPYEEMVDYYGDILSNIYKEIQEVTPIEYGDELCEIKYPKEYHEAYGWLQKAEWRLTDTATLKEYYDEPEFKYYAIHNLKNVQHRIISYLDETNFEYSEKVTDCHKYDEIVDMNKELINDDEFHKWWDYYYKLKHLKITVDLLDLRVKWIKDNVEYLKEDVEDEIHEKRIVNVEEVMAQILELEKIINNLEIRYIEIKP